MGYVSNLLVTSATQPNTFSYVPNRIELRCASTVPTARKRDRREEYPHIRIFRPLLSSRQVAGLQKG